MRARQILCCCLFVSSGCVEDSLRQESSLMIEEIVPQILKRGEPFSMSGSGFGIEGDEDQVTLSGEKLDVIYWSANRIECRAPRSHRGEHGVLVLSAGGRVSEAMYVKFSPSLLDMEGVMESDGLP